MGCHDAQSVHVSFLNVFCPVGKIYIFIDHFSNHGFNFWLSQKRQQVLFAHVSFEVAMLYP